MGDILMKYQDEVIKAMKMLNSIDNVVFLGQNIKYGSCIYGTMSDLSHRIEMPIAEDMQMGISIGLSLNGFLPVSVYERMDFLLLALNQLVNHLDKIETMSNGIFKPKVIIRTIVGSKKPLNPGLQHSQDHTDMLRVCLSNVNVVKLVNASDVMKGYRDAVSSDKSTVIVELRENYDNDL